MTVGGVAARAGRLALVLALAGAAWPLGATEQDVHGWLHKMTEAARTLNYEGTFVYRHQEGVEAVSIVHRYAHGREQERIVHLNGAPREVLRDEDGVTCILPDDHSVVVGGGDAPDPLALDFGPENLPRIQSSYRFSLGGVERVTSRSAQRISIQPLDEFRYGYELWVDRDSHLLLRADLTDATGSALEQMMFVTLSLPDSIPERALEPTIGVKGWKWYEEDAEQKAAPTAQSSAWQVAWLPPGFRATSQGVRQLQRITVPVEYLGFSDGLASLSVFVELAGNQTAMAPTVRSMGAVHAYSGVVDGHRVTVMGEVPVVTVERVAASVRQVRESRHD